MPLVVVPLRPVAVALVAAVQQVDPTLLPVGKPGQPAAPSPGPQGAVVPPVLVARAVAPLLVARMVLAPACLPH